MNPRITQAGQSWQSWIPSNRIEEVVQFEFLIFLLVLALISWLVYQFFLRKVSPERHKSLKKLYKNLLYHIIIGLCYFACYFTLESISRTAPALKRITPYFGLLTIFWAAVIFIKTCRIFISEYLFFVNMRAGVPLVIVNLLTLLISLVMGFWILSGIFGVNLVPLLATSAIFSIVLGLALQETLGNLIAGVTLQFDKPYEIGDWIEVQSGGQKWVGMVNEISWRATLLIGFGEELITIPNRVMAQAPVCNFSAKTRPFIRVHIIRVSYTENIDRVKDILLRSIRNTPGVKEDPSPLALVADITESWLAFKLVYYIDDYGIQVIIGDRVISKAMAALNQAGIQIAPQKLQINLNS